MLLDLTGLKITQTSAKERNREMGVRAHDAGHTELLAFLFLTPENKKQTAATCLQQDLQQIRKDHGKFTEQLNPLHTDNSDTASIALTYPNDYQTLYKYAGTADECLVIQVYADKGSKLNLAEASALLSRQHYDPHYLPAAEDVVQYQGIRGQAIISSGTPVAGTLTPKMLVTWYGPGGIPMPTSPEWKLTLLTAYNKAARPAAEFKNDTTNVIASFIISENLSGNPTSEGCRKDVMDGILKQEGPIISNSIDGKMSDGHGGQFATASHLTQLPGGGHNQDFFAFAGNKKVCAEIHVSTVAGKPDEDKRLQDAIAEFHPELDYVPNSLDYFTLASTFYKESPMLAAPFYDASVKSLPTELKDPELITRRRIATDNIVMALGMSGNIKASRTFAERAIKSDPDYPLNYYNLACADAEQGKAADAKLHLQQAFDRKANTIPGEHLPDPTQDDSILKLKKDKEFWAFVQTLK
jgi:tetratricopeptide (TPR) repeat protein